MLKESQCGEALSARGVASEEAGEGSKLGLATWLCRFTLRIWVTSRTVLTLQVE